MKRPLDYVIVRASTTVELSDAVQSYLQNNPSLMCWGGVRIDAHGDWFYQTLSRAPRRRFVDFVTAFVVILLLASAIGGSFALVWIAAGQ